jgi:predicted neutral ceramidase superfamily lipid hydrolase
MKIKTYLLSESVPFGVLAIILFDDLYSEIFLLCLTTILISIFMCLFVPASILNQKVKNNEKAMFITAIPLIFFITGGCLISIIWGIRMNM